MTTDTTGDRPIFLAGVDRSGIGLLGELLEAHPEIVLTRRTGLFSQLAERWSSGGGDTAGEAIAEVLSMPRIARLDLDADAVQRRLRSASRDGFDGIDLYVAAAREYRDVSGAQRWGDKSLGAEQYASRIFDRFPDATMIHMVRDPGDRYASQANHRTASRGRAASGGALWNWSAELAIANEGRFQNYLVLRLEDLLRDPQASLAAVWSHVGVSPIRVPEFFDPHRVDSIGRKVRDLSPRELQLLTTMCRRHAPHFGYDTPEHSGPVRSEPLRRGLGWVASAGWRARNRRLRAIP